MELETIEKLLDKYFEANTTKAEEETLRQYFSQETIASSLEQYRPIFNYFSEAKNEQYTQQVSLTNNIDRGKGHYFKWASVAAILLLFGIFFGKSYWVTATPETLEEAYTKEEIAQAQKAFRLLTHNFNKGTEQLAHLNEFEKRTNKFLKQ